MTSGGVTFDLYSGEHFDRVAVSFQLCDGFFFRHVLVLSFPFFFFLFVFLIQECTQ